MNLQKKKKKKAEENGAQRLGLSKKASIFLSGVREISFDSRD